MPKRIDLAGTGELEPRVRQALAWLEKNGMDVFWGRVQGENGFLRAVWDEDIVPDVESFLALAKRNEARIVFVDCTVCRRSDLSDETTSSDSEELQELLSKLAGHDGELAEVTLSWVAERTLFQFAFGASWAQDYVAALEHLDSGEDEDSEEDNEEDDLDDAEVERQAEILASDPMFKSAPSAKKQAYVARKVLDDAVTANRELFEAVVERAKIIFDLEVKPEEERRLIDKVEELRQQGVTRAEIARRLGI